MGCIISKKKSPKRNHHHQRKESSEKRSSSRIDDSSQSKEEQQDRSKFSSTRLSPEIAEIGDTDEDEDEDKDKELKRKPSTVVAKEELEVAAGWPAWLVSVAGEALVGWTPRRASTFEKLEKVSIQFGSYGELCFNECFFLLCRLDKVRTAVSTRLVISWITRLLRLKESGLISAI